MSVPGALKLLRLEPATICCSSNGVEMPFVVERNDDVHFLNDRDQSTKTIKESVVRCLAPEPDYFPGVSLHLTEAL